jgi:ABC-type spermidine/putrescine transport system permease subunit II
VAVTALSLGEIGAAARVETPGWETFAKILFDRMHYGVANDVAALGLLLLAGVAMTAGLWGLIRVVVCVSRSQRARCERET